MDSTRSLESTESNKKKQTVSSIVRKSFRVPVDKDEIQAIIEGQVFPVVDISLTGISIACEQEPLFDVSQEIRDCQLKMSTGRIEGLKGKIVHYSCSTEKDWHHGIQWVELDAASVDKIEILVLELKDKLLKSTETS